MYIRKNECGSWTARVYYRKEGKQAHKTITGRTKRETEAAAQKFLDSLARSPKITVEQLTEQYFSDKGPRLKEISIRNKRGLINKWILPDFGDRRIGELTAHDLMQWQNKLLAADLSDAHRRNIDSLMRVLLNHACRYDDLGKNPMAKLDHIGKTGRRLDYWTLDEYNSFMAVPGLGDPARTMIEVLFYSGLRIGELLALTGNDLDFDRKLIDVNKTAHWRIGGEYYTTSPKTSNSVRSVIMPGSVMGNLREYSSRMYGFKPETRVFPFTDGPARYAINTLSEKAGVKRIPVHGLRHSHASMLIHDGFSPKAVAERLGDTEQMIMTVYGHLYTSVHQDMADKLEEHFQHS